MSYSQEKGYQAPMYQQQSNNGNYAQSQWGNEKASPYQKNTQYPSSPSYNGQPLPAVSAKQLDPEKAPTKYRDVWAAGLFLTHLLALVGYFIYIMKKVFTMMKENGGSVSSDFHPQLGKFIALGALVALTVTVAYFTLMYFFPTRMIHGTFGGFVVLCLMLAAEVYVTTKQFDWPILIPAITTTIVWYLLSARIPLASIILKSVVGLIGKYKKLLLLPVFSLIGTLFYLVNVVTVFIWVISTSKETVNGKNGEAFVWFVYLSLFFSLVWTTQVFQNVSRVTIAGVFASHFFGTGVRHPVLKSFRRAVTWSFGSICLGSMFIATLDTLVHVLRPIRGGLLGLLARFLLKKVKEAVRYFNAYAFTEVAIYGKSYVEAAKDTFALAKSRGLEAVANDLIIGKVLTCATFVLVWFVGDILSQMTSGNSEKRYLLIGCSVLFTFMFMIVASSVISAGVISIFVCMCEDPEAVQNAQPEFFNSVASKYPEMVLKV